MRERAKQREGERERKGLCVRARVCASEREREREREGEMIQEGEEGGDIKLRERFLWGRCCRLQREEGEGVSKDNFASAS